MEPGRFSQVLKKVQGHSRSYLNTSQDEKRPGGSRTDMWSVGNLQRSYERKKGMISRNKGQGHAQPPSSPHCSPHPTPQRLITPLFPLAGPEALQHQLWALPMGPSPSTSLLPVLTPGNTQPPLETGLARVCLLCDTGPC